VREFGINKDEVLKDAKQQEALFYKVFPKQVEQGPQKASTYKWLLTRCADGSEKAVAYRSRGEVYRHLGQYDKALEDFDRGEAINPEEWEKDIVFGLLYQADCHARLGDEDAALAHCARLPDDFWTPGLAGAPSGNKADVAEKLRQIAAAARRMRE
jgi:tetratricopeptide (TPR) repeat protein